MEKEKRPNYPNCVMTPEVIRGVKQRQEEWDRKYKNKKNNK